jgi:proline iminopeptidase
MVACGAARRKPVGHESGLMKIMNLRRGLTAGLAPRGGPWRARYHAGVPGRDLYPDQPPLRIHAVDVPGGHRLHVREWGREDGLPALLLHGGPGSGCAPVLWRTFDPERYRVIAPDQRGAGLSAPRGDIRHNTLADLLADLRHLRRRLGIERWLVVGGSWGATLALAHALDEPDAVTGLLLRASFLARDTDIACFFQQPPAGLEPAWRAFRDAVAPGPGQTLLAALHDGLTSSSTPPAQRRQLALAWWRWERSLARGQAEAATLEGPALDAQVDRLRVQAHFLAHACWLGEPTLPERCAARPPRMPVRLVHGRDDRICPPAGATLLHAALPGSTLQWIAGAGHDPAHPAMVHAMVWALDTWAANTSWPREPSA